MWFIAIKLEYFIRVIKIIETICCYYYTLEWFLPKHQHRNQVIKISSHKAMKQM
jgi:hypothetical protein